MCKTYRCNVLKSYENHEIPLEEAKRLVNNVKNASNKEFDEEIKKFINYHSNLDFS